jgi:hypothetical protein
MSTDWTTTKRRHGTHSGWSLHITLRERPCDPCYHAKQQYDRRRRSAPEQTRRSRLSAKAQIGAYRELAHRYPDEYRAAYQRIKAEVFAAAADSDGGVS